MTNTEAVFPVETPDADLVSQSLAGNREAFSLIVRRYQSLVCSLAYSATGSLSQSEDLAQETFVAAWRQLRGLREPARLRAWLCQITRYHIYDALKAQDREPSHAAESLEAVHEAPAPEPLPAETTISNEEAAILWRSLGKIPEIYREPLVLFYREHHSIEQVAQTLELSEDAVKQRLSRGRKLLEEQVRTFVEGALERTTPGRAFTLGVLSALPAGTLPAAAATAGLGSAKGGATKMAAGFSGAFLGLFSIFFSFYSSYLIGLEYTRSDQERTSLRHFYRAAALGFAAFLLAFALLNFWAFKHAHLHPRMFSGLVLGLAAATTLGIIGFMLWSIHRRRALKAQLVALAPLAPARPAAWEYRSKLVLLGLPLIHINLSGGSDRQPAKAWIAVGGQAIGGLFAFGGLAVAPVSVGAVPIGLVSWGAMAIGVFSLGAFSLGGWAAGGVAIGWWAVGALAVGWHAAGGFLVVARDFAAGYFAQAAQANNEAAREVIASSTFYHGIEFINRHELIINLCWMIPLFLWWRIARRRNQAVTNL